MGKKRKPSLAARTWKQARKRGGDVALQHPFVAKQLSRHAAELRRQSEARFQSDKESNS